MDQDLLKEQWEETSQNAYTEIPFGEILSLRRGINLNHKTDKHKHFSLFAIRYWKL